MAQPVDPSSNVRRVTLPSGRAIEVVCLTPGDARVQPQELHLCEHCGGELVYPVSWSESGATHWEVVRRCPECEHHTSARYDQETVDRFDDQLNAGMDKLTDALRRFERANMETELERFVHALDRGGILPEDF